MRITEIKIKLVSRQTDKLLAFASVTFDQSFVVRDIRVIQGNNALFVAMPSRKMTDRCPQCGTKNHLQAQYCNQCGKRQGENRSRTDSRGRAKLHADIAHPINSRCRNELQEAILKSFNEELERSRQPGYVPALYDEFDAGPEGDDTEDVADTTAPAAQKTRPPTRLRMKPAPPPTPAPAEPPPKSKSAGASGSGHTATDASSTPPPDGGGFGIFGNDR